MHVMAIRSDVFARHPWLAVRLYEAFDKAKNNSIKRLLDPGRSVYPLSWNYDNAARLTALFGEDLWPYGVQANRTTLDAFLQYGYEQGVCHKRLRPEELFPPQVQEFLTT